MLGKPIHFIALIGFLTFYGMQTLVFKISLNTSKEKNYTFAIELVFYCLYNALIVYTLPEHFNNIFITASLYIVALGLHLLNRNHGLSQKYQEQFKGWGSYTLIEALFLGFVTDNFWLVNNELFANILTAILAGFILFNIFAEELQIQSLQPLFGF